jgi:L-asparaginase
MRRAFPFISGIVFWSLLWMPSPAPAAELPKVLVIGTGGTISGGIDPATGEAKSLTAKDLVQLVPSLKGKVEIEEEDFVRIGSSSMTPEIQFRLAARIQELFQKRPDLAGIVITHGTDSLEETAYLVDLVYGDERPVVFAAAQRPPRVSDSDGPRNLEGAILTAIAPKSRGKGALVVLNDDIHSARYVTKSHSIAVESFRSGKKGMLGTIDGGKVIYYNAPLNRLKIETARIDPGVDLIRLVAGDTGKFILHAAETKASGIVIEAFGRGNMPAPVADAVQRARKAGVIVVVVTRTQEGRVELPATLIKAGVIEGEDLGGLKARILLMLALGTTRDPAKIQELFRQAAGTASQ